MKSRFSQTLIRSSQFAALILSTMFFNTATQAEGLKVVEMFTSQGCYSCPAADKLLAELAEDRDDILNLEFHVDYWNQLRYRGEGNWVDPYSAPEYSLRQRQYSANRLAGQNGVYTPQAVINGVYGNVGSNRRAMNKGLGLDYQMPIAVTINRENDTTLSVNLDGQSSIDADVYLVSYLKLTETLVTSGENHDKVMENHNVVIDMKPIAKLSETGDTPLQVAYAGGGNRGCAVLVQPAQQGAILGAARCP